MQVRSVYGHFCVLPFSHGVENPHEGDFRRVGASVGARVRRRTPTEYVIAIVAQFCSYSNYPEENTENRKAISSPAAINAILIAGVASWRVGNGNKGGHARS